MANNTTMSIKARVVSVSFTGITLDNGIYLPKSYVHNWPERMEMEPALINTKDPITLMVPRWVAVQRGLL